MARNISDSRRILPHEALSAIGLCVPIAITNPSGFLGYQAAFLLLTPISILVVVLVALRNARNSIPAKGVIWAVGGFLGAAVLSAMLSDAPLIAVVGATGRSTGLSSIALVVSLSWCGFVVAKFEHGVEAVLRVLTCTGLVMSLGSLLQRIEVLLPGFPGLGPSRRILGPMGSASQVGAMLLVLALCAVALSMDHRESRSWRTFAIATSVPMFMVVVLSGSRAAWLGGCTAALVLIGHPATRRRMSRRYVWTSVLVAASLALLTVVVTSTRVRLMAIFRARNGVLDGRIDIWRAAVPAWFERPIQGFGLDQSRAPIMRHLARTFETVYGSGDTVDRAHSVIFDQLLWGGFIGLISLVALLVVWSRHVGVRRLAPRDVVLFSAVIGYLVHLSFNFPVPESDRVVWILGGVLLAGTSHTNKNPGHLKLSLPLVVGVAMVPLTIIGGMNFVADQRLQHAITTESRVGSASSTGLYAAAREAGGFFPLYKETYARALLRAGEISPLVDAAVSAQRSYATDPVLLELELRTRTQVAFVTDDKDSALSLVASYRGLCADYPSRISFQVGLALAELSAGLVDEARRTATLASMRAPKDPTPETVLSLIENRAGNYDASQRHMDEATRRSKQRQ